MRQIILAFAALLAASHQAALALAEPSTLAAPSIRQLRAGLTGEWSGALEYRDYQSDRLTRLPVETRIHSAGDGLTQIRASRFDEGSGRAPVWTVTVSGFVGAEGQLTSTFYRAGRPVEVETETAALDRYVSPTDWIIVYTQTGSDDDAPAEIRVTETLQGGELLAVKHVRPLSPAGQDWAFRNQTRLRRSSDATD